jgi:hypothetical protein
MNHQTRRTSGLKRSATALGATVLVLGSLALGACSKTETAGTVGATAGRTQQDSAATATLDGDTVELVSAALEIPAADDTSQGADAGKGDRKGLRARMLRALHGSWVTEGKTGPVTHQAVRGEVTAVSGGSITVRAKDGFSLTFAVSGDTRVRARANRKGSDSTIGAVKVGSKALVTGVGATSPKARLVVFRTTPA